MIQHYSKVALRNLMKYKTQNLISTIGLAVGLLCFSICFYCDTSIEYCQYSQTGISVQKMKQLFSRSFKDLKNSYLADYCSIVTRSVSPIPSTR